MSMNCNSHDTDKALAPPTTALQLDMLRGRCADEEGLAFAGAE